MADEQQPQNPPDLAGYPSVEELVRGYRASSAEAKRLSAENARKDQEWAERMNAVNPRPDVTQRSRPEDRMAEFGIPVDAVDQFVTERVAQALAPLARGVEARTKILSDYPDYNKFEADVAQFIQSDPDLNARYLRMFNADPAGAMELAILKFSEAKRRTSPTQNAPDSQQSADAAIPTQRAGEARRAPQTTNSAEVEDAWQEYKRTGSKTAAERFARARLRNVISDEFLMQ